jgi:hypothetical protein
LSAVTHELCAHMKVHHKDDASRAYLFSIRMSLIEKVFSCASPGVEGRLGTARILNY